MRLFTYIVKHDAGSAPNPYWGLCTLAICKPAIRRSAAVGDWIIGFGSKNTLRGDYSGRMIYAMRVDDKMAMSDYFTFCQRQVPQKIADWEHPDRRRQYGDCIYRFQRNGHVRQLPSVHDESQITRDLSGAYVLTSQQYWYWGKDAKKIPQRFAEIVPSTQGHRVKKNDAAKDAVVRWLSKITKPRQFVPINDFSDGSKC